MSIIDKAFAMAERAERWLKDAQSAFDHKSYDNTLYICQICVETAAKAVLTALGIDYPREHDVAPVFINLAQREDLPGWFKGRLPRFQRAFPSSPRSGD